MGSGVHGWVGEPKSSEGSKSVHVSGEWISKVRSHWGIGGVMI